MLTDLQKSFDKASLSYCALHGLGRDQDWVMLKLFEDVGELTQVWNTMTGRGRDKGLSDADLKLALASEVADALGMLFVFAHQHDLDLPDAIHRKWHFDPQELG